MIEGIFEHSEYKAFLREQVGSKHQRRGVKSALARALHCQPTYISQVVHGDSHFSLEQAEKVGRFLGLAPEAQLFFLLLVQKSRAGTPELRRIFEEQIEAAKAKRLVLTERLGAKAVLSREDQTTYYGSWHYAAVHIAVTIPRLASREKLGKFLRIPRRRLHEVVGFLVEKEILREQGGVLSPGIAELRLGNDSANIIRHHANWRTRALLSLDHEDAEELHYSAVVTLARDDVRRIKDQILEALRRNLDVIRASKEEELFCYTIDFFSLAADKE